MKKSELRQMIREEIQQLTENAPKIVEIALDKHERAIQSAIDKELRKIESDLLKKYKNKQLKLPGDSADDYSVVSSVSVELGEEEDDLFIFFQRGGPEIDSASPSIDVLEGGKKRRETVPLKKYLDNISKAVNAVTGKLEKELSSKYKGKKVAPMTQDHAGFASPAIVKAVKVTFESGLLYVNFTFSSGKTLELDPIDSAIKLYS
jgi:vacuolar-type H+-ATPase subunit E/Vma4